MDILQEKLFDCESDAWIATLPKYQQEIITQLYNEYNDYEQVAKKWLQGSLSTTVVFGTEKGKSVYFEKVLDEIEAFLTGDEKYQHTRLEILKQTGALQTYAVGVLSVAMAPVLGNTSVFLAPVIAIGFVIVGQIGINAWLEARKEKRKNNNS